jgi:pimeloyl-ACP methyl ester carboxylesterase
VEPLSHFFYSHRLKLQFWDWGTEDKPPLILVHGGLDHARNWDWVARALREDFHVYAYDLRGHGNSQWAPGAAYSIPEHVLDLAALADVIRQRPVYLIGHSLGGIISLVYAAIHPDRVHKLVSIEGWGPPPAHPMFQPAAPRLRRWVEKVRETEHRALHSYPDLESAVKRMKEANPHLSDEVARHLTLHGTNWNADGSLSWKFDNFARIMAPFGSQIDEARDLWSQIDCPVLLFKGLESWASDPEEDPRATAIRNRRVIRVAKAGHWVHHDQLALFLDETKRFLAESVTSETRPQR